MLASRRTLITALANSLLCSMISIWIAPPLKGLVIGERGEVEGMIQVEENNSFNAAPHTPMQKIGISFHAGDCTASTNSLYCCLYCFNSCCLLARRKIVKKWWERRGERRVVKLGSEICNVSIAYRCVVKYSSISWYLSLLISLVYQYFIFTIEIQRERAWD